MMRLLPWLCWFLVGSALCILWSLAWLEAVQFRHTVESVQAWVGPPAGMLGRVDGWLHAIVAAGSALWLAWGLRQMGRPWWIATLVVGGLAVIDELAQRTSGSQRSFDGVDLAWTIIGLLMATAWQVTRPTTTGDAGRPPTRRRR